MSISNPPGELSHKLKDFYGLREVAASEGPRVPQPPPPPPQLLQVVETPETQIDVDELLRTKSLSELMKLATDSALKAQALETQLQVMLQDKYQSLFRTMAGLAAMEQVAAAATSSAKQAATAATLMADTEEIVEKDTWPRFDRLAEALEEQEMLTNLKSLAVMPKEVNERIVGGLFEEGLSLVLESKVLARHSRREIPGMEDGRVRDFVQALTLQCNSCVDGIALKLKSLDFWLDPKLTESVSESIQAIFSKDKTSTSVSDFLLTDCKWPEKILSDDCLHSLDRVFELLNQVALSIDGFEITKMQSLMTANSIAGFRVAVEHFLELILTRLSQRTLAQALTLAAAMVLSLNRSIRVFIESLAERTDSATADKAECECNDLLWQSCCKAIEMILRGEGLTTVKEDDDKAIRSRASILRDAAKTSWSSSSSPHAVDFTSKIFSFIQLVHLETTMQPSSQSCAAQLFSPPTEDGGRGVKLQQAIEGATIQIAERCCEAFSESDETVRLVAMTLSLSTALPLLCVALAKYLLSPDSNAKIHETEWFAEIAMQLIGIPGDGSEHLQTYTLSSLMKMLDEQMKLRCPSVDATDNGIYDLIFACEILSGKVLNQLRALARRFQVEVWDPAPLSVAVQEASAGLQEHAIAMASRRLVSAIEVSTSTEMLSLCEEGPRPAVGSVLELLNTLTSHLELKGARSFDCEFADLYLSMFTSNSSASNGELDPQMLKIEISMKSLPDMLLKLTRGLLSWQRKLLTNVALSAWKFYADDVVRSQSESESPARALDELYIPTILFLMTQTANLILDASALRNNRKGREIMNYLLGIMCNITAASVADDGEGGLKDLQWIRWSQENAGKTHAKVKEWCDTLACPPLPDK